MWIGLPGQLGDMHGLAKEFAGAKDKAKVLKKAEAAAAKLPSADAEHGKYYVKVMTKASADGEFVTKETARLKKMQDDGSVSAAKKEQFGRRLNILNIAAAEHDARSRQSQLSSDGITQAPASGRDQVNSVS